MTNGEEPRSQLVVVGSSAGGIDALSTLVGTLPADFPAPIVIAQHLDRRRISHLGEILQRHSPLPVRTVEEQEPLEAGVIYVVPANRDVEITDHEVRVHAAGGINRPSVDRLLRSAAQVYGERLIAVILTGTGSDGAAGAREVKEAGGTVVIQNPQTASFPGMPLSLAPTTVDVVANLENIGPLLVELLDASTKPIRPADERSLRALLDELRDRSGIDFTAYKTPTIQRRLQRRMAATGSDNLGAYIRLLQNDPEEYRRLTASFLIKVTEFFRDPELYTYLREQVLPELIAEARQRGDELRMWSAGCATGEEAYSLAILVVDLLDGQLDRFNVRIFATDLDGEAVAFARHGVYPAAALANVPPDLLARYFNQIDGDYEIKKSIRSVLIFGQHDLGQRAPFPRIDLTLCRNVLIYFTTELQRRALQLFAFSLRTGGVLVLGKAETTSPLAEHFVLEHPQLKIYRRHGDPVLIPPARIRDATPTRPAVNVGRQVPSVPDMTALRTQREGQRSRPAGDRSEDILAQLPVGVVVVDRRYDIQMINGIARRHLGIHGAAVGEDLIHLARSVPSGPLRGAIDRALTADPATTVDEVLTAETPTGEVRYLQLVCQQRPIDGSSDATGLVTLLVTDITGPLGARRDLAEGFTRQQAEIARLTAVVERLAETNRQLLAANEELTSANAELRSANEEFLVANEEVQAATEEAETLNEELQATNEELETLNEELQATVEELNTTNDDLQARSIELQDLAVSLEAQRQQSDAERARLAAILASMGDAVLVVDGGGLPLLTNEAYDELFGGAGDAFLPEDPEGRPLPAAEHPQQRAARRESFVMEFTLTGPGGERRWYEATGRPIESDGQAGGVLVIRDITDRSLQRLQEQFIGMVSHELRTPLTSLRGYLQLLLRRLSDDAGEPARLGSMALSQVDRLTALVDDLLDATRSQSGKLSLKREPTDLGPLVTRTCEVAQAVAQGQEIAESIPNEPVIVNADAGRLEQVLLNLLTNAITHARGTERIDLRLRREGDAAVIEVQDYGPGIPEAERARLFTRFYQVSRGDRQASGGLGLGLYIAHEIVTAHGGSIDVRSDEGAGATFTVRLPLAGN
jgi:two-component system, chemotaxis family, CheB/CheR fusion protein